MSHYSDCTNRALWLNFKNPADDFSFYVGSGIPVQERFAGLRVDAVVIGPGLPALTAEQLALLPAEVQADAIWQVDGIGAKLYQSPADQSNCDHLGATMTAASTVVNGRCDFYETFGRTNSWRVLDADGIKIPTKGEEYHVAVWLQDNTSGKFGVAVGTWKEDFRSAFDLATPGCERDMKHFAEQKAEVNPDCFPVVSCPGAPAISKTMCEARDDACGGAAVDTAGAAAAEAMMGGCGGEQCPAALSLWAAVNMKMHTGMALDFTGDSEVDFVRGMLPHHAGALDMCAVLLELECVTMEDVAALEGMVHFCNHVEREQVRESDGMKSWLTENNHAVEAKCAAKEEKKTDTTDHSGMDHGSMNHGGGGRHSRMADEMDHGSMGGMSMGCGNLAAAKPYVDANMLMHTSMAVSLTCTHTVDFVRAMIPHHKGAIAMCEVLVSEDAYLVELCVNITRVQRAEVAWMSQWLDARDHAVDAPCGLDANGNCPSDKDKTVLPFGGETPALPCENTLPTSSFCHTLDGGVNEAYCTCERAAADHACGSTAMVDGLAILDMDAECARFCGLCPSGARPDLFPQACPHYEPPKVDEKDGGCAGFGADNGCDGEEVCCSGTCRAAQCAAWETLGADSDGAAGVSPASAVHTSSLAASIVAVVAVAMW